VDARRVEFRKNHQADRCGLGYRLIMPMPLTHWKRGLALGSLSWLLPFVFSMPLLPLKQANPPLFQAVMALAVMAVAAMLARRYFRGAVSLRASEAVLLGLLWLVVNLVLDYPMFAYGPMRMSAARYYSEIGASYLLYPAFLGGAAWISGRPPRTT
jgi:hypothetical protein